MSLLGVPLTQEFEPHTRHGYFANGAGAGATLTDLIELDYRQSKDGVPVVIHDATLDRTTDARKRWRQRRIKVADKTAAEIRNLDAGSWYQPKFAGVKVPLVTEALDFICASGGVALIEHKSGDAKTLVQLLRERKLINKVVVISFDWSYLRKFHELEPRQVLGALGPPTHLVSGKRPSRVSKTLDVTWLDELEKTAARVAVWNRQVTCAAIGLMHRRGLQVWVYTVNEPKLVGRLLDKGVRGIITNAVSLIKVIVQSR